MKKRTAFALVSPLLPKGEANAKGEGRIRAASRKSWTQRNKSFRELLRKSWYFWEDVETRYITLLLPFRANL